MSEKRAESSVLMTHPVGLHARPSVKLGEAAASLARLLHPEVSW